MIRSFKDEYRNGRIPNKLALLNTDGSTAEWSVTMLEWAFPWWCQWLATSVSTFMSRCLSWRKRFRQAGATVLGENVTLSTWGFFIVDRTCDDLIFEGQGNGMIDEVRSIGDPGAPPDRMIGRFYYQGVFRGWFELRRIWRKD